MANTLVTSRTLYNNGLPDYTIADFKSTGARWMTVKGFIKAMSERFINLENFYQNFQLTGVCRVWYNKKIWKEIKYVNGVWVWCKIYDPTHHKPRNVYIKTVYPKEEVRT